MKRRVLYFLIMPHISGWVSSYAGDVETICSTTGVNVLKLEYRENAGNLDIIRKADLGRSELSQFLTQLYQEQTVDQSEFLNIGTESNRRFIPGSPFKEIFLNYASVDSRLEDPSGYRDALLASIDSLIPGDMNVTNWFLYLRDPSVFTTAIRPARGSETGEMYGAITRYTMRPDGNWRIEIVFSNNESESLPYLISLIVHEFQHVLSYQDHLSIKGEEEAAISWIVEEAKAYDAQMRAYIALASDNPSLFCNWLYPTWAYGDLLVPLSWTMNSMETAMRSGTYLYDYARNGSHKEEYLLNPEKKALRSDIQNIISSLNLKYIK